MIRREPHCPKTMVHGPCGGVTDRGCEVDGRRCPFVSSPLVEWPGTEQAPRPVDLPEVIVDLRPRADEPDFDAAIRVLRDAGVGALLGEHLDDRPDLSNPSTAAAVVDRGVPTIATVTCRDRDVDRSAERIRALAEAGVSAVLCVTGDHPAARFGEDHTARFELDSVQLADVARSVGVVVAVAESPASAPVALRPARIVTKQRAGADLGILNHAGDVDDLVRFADRAAELGATLALAAPVPVVTDPGSLRALTQFPGVHLPRRFTERPASTGFDGIAEAVELGRRLLASGRFGHVNLSGRGTTDGQLARNRLMARVAERIRHRAGP